MIEASTSDNGSEDSTTRSSEKDSTAEGNNSGGTERGRKTEIRADINTGIVMMSTEDEPEEKVPKAVGKQRKVVP